MTINKIGRPSKAVERRRQILLATRAVVARHGLAEATLARIAAEADVQRTLVAHYFGDRASLVRTFVAEAVAAYGDAMLRHGAGVALEDRLETFFAATAYASHEDLAVWLELVAVAARDDGVRGQLRSLWTTRWLPALEGQLAEEHPEASPDAVAGAAYGFTCLFEAHWAFRAQGVDETAREHHARRAARAILADLRGTD